MTDTRHASDAADAGAAVWSSAAALVGDRLRRGFLLVLALAVACALLGPALITIIPRSFLATAQIVIDPRGLQVFAGEQGGPVVDANAGINFVETQAQLLTSERVLARVVRALGDDPAQPKADEAHTLELRPTLDQNGPTADSKAIAALRRNLTIKRGERSFVIDVTAKASTPERAATTANAVVKAFIEEDAAARAEAGRRLNSELAGRLSTLRQQLSKSEAVAEAFRDEHGLLWGANGRLLSEQRLEQATTALGDVQLRVARAQSRVSQLQTAKLDIGSLGPLTAIEDMRTVSYLIERLSTAREALADARLNLGPRHPALTSLQSRVDEIERRIKGEVGRVREAEKTDLDRARGELTAGERNVASLSDRVSKDLKASVELRALEQQVKANRDLLTTFETRSREADEFSRVSPANLRVASVATPNEPGSRLVMTLGAAVVGAILGAMLGIAAIAFWAFAAPGRPVAAARAADPAQAGVRTA